MATQVVPRKLPDGVTVNTAVLAAKAAPYTPTMPAAFTVGGGNVVLVWVCWVAPAPTVSVTGGGCSWQLVRQYGNTVIGGHLFLGIVDGSDTTAFTVNSAGACGVQVIEVMGCDPIEPWTTGNEAVSNRTGSLQIWTTAAIAGADHKGAFFGSGADISAAANWNGTASPASVVVYGTGANTSGGKATSNIEQAGIGWVDVTALPAGTHPNVALNLGTAADTFGASIWLNDLLATRVSGDDVGTGVDDHTYAGPEIQYLSSDDSGGAVDEATSITVLGPPVTIELYEAGVFLQTLYTGHLVPSTISTLDLDFDASLLTDKTGAGVEVRIFGGDEGGTINIDSVAWDAQYLVPDELPKSGSDSGGAVTEGDSTNREMTSDDVGTGTDAASALNKQEEGLSLSASDSTTSVVESEVVDVAHAGDDSSTSSEATTLVATYVLDDSATGVDDILTIGRSFDAQDSATATSESFALDRTVLASDSGVAGDYESVQKPPKVMLHSAERTLVGRASFDLQ